MIDSDVKLLEKQVDIEAQDQVHIKAPDLCLDSKDRRTNNSPYRRALVHDHTPMDSLTVNWGNDYPAGVRINDLQVVNSSKDLRVDVASGQVILNTKELILDNAAVPEPAQPSKKIALSHMEGDKLGINKGKGYTGGVTIYGDVTTVGALVCNVLQAYTSPLGRTMTIDADALILNCKNWVTILSKDMIVSNPEIHETGSATAQNYALSHTLGDKLVINKGKGYKGGVEIEGAVTIKDSLQLDKSIVEHIAGPTPQETRVVNGVRSIVLHNGTIEVQTHMYGGPKKVLDLIEEIKSLRKKIEALETRVNRP